MRDTDTFEFEDIFLWIYNQWHKFYLYKFMRNSFFDTTHRLNEYREK